MAVQVGASSLEKEHGGKGVLLGGVPGTRRGRVVILGGGVVGRNAATIAVGMGAQVTVLDVQATTMTYLEDIFGGAVETLYSNPINIEMACQRADLVGERPEHGRGQDGVEGDHARELTRQREDPLSVGHARQNSVRQVGSLLIHAPAGARRAEPHLAPVGVL
jgi:hypothetical protein